MSHINLFYLTRRITIGILASVLLTISCQTPTETYDTLHPTVENKNAPIKFTESQTAKLNAALVIAESSFKDPLFEKILKDQSNTYSWDYGRLDLIEERHRKDPVTFFLSEFKNRGLPKIDKFVARDGYDNDDVTGSTAPCSENINFNVDNLDRTSRTAVYVAGTIVHERVHSFCFQHRSQDVGEEYNLCDFTYNAGHLAIIIDQYRANGSKPIGKPPISICKSLVKKLQDENILNK